MKPPDRKKQLIAQGRVYRAEVVLAKEAVRTGLRPEALARNILSHAAISAIAAFRHRGSEGAAGLSASTVLPLLMSGVSALSKKKSALKPILRGALIGSVVAGALAIVLKKKPAAPDQS